MSSAAAQSGARSQPNRRSRVWLAVTNAQKSRPEVCTPYRTTWGKALVAYHAKTGWFVPRRPAPARDALVCGTQDLDGAEAICTDPRGKARRPGAGVKVRRGKSVLLDPLEPAADLSRSCHA